MSAVSDQIDATFRDFASYDVDNPLPIGDPESGVHSPRKYDIRALLLAMAQGLFAPLASVTPAQNGDLVVEKTSNTTLTFRLRGSDGVVRSGTITLA